MTRDKTASLKPLFPQILKRKEMGHVRQLLECVEFPGAAPTSPPLYSPHSSAVTFSLRLTPTPALPYSELGFPASGFSLLRLLCFTLPPNPQAEESELFTPSVFGLPKSLSLKLQWARAHSILLASPLASNPPASRLSYYCIPRTSSWHGPP